MLINDAYRKPLLLVMAGSLILLGGCNMPGLSVTQTPAASLTPSTIPYTATPPPPTPTTPPLAMRVNGEGIWLEDYQEEITRLKRAQAETGNTLSDEQAAKMVQDSLAGDLLLGQSAVKDGYSPTEADLQASLDKTTQAMGGADKLAAWMKANEYSEASLKRSLARALAADWERNKIIAAVPTVTEQVHVRQILVRDETTATGLYEQLQGGKKFDDLAAKYDPETSGDLGWFPRGILFQKDVETAAFNLQPGQYSNVIKTSNGYQIIELVERDPQHPVAPEVRLALQHKLIESWMQDATAHAKIELLVK